MVGLALRRVPTQGEGGHQDRRRTLLVPAELTILEGTNSCCGRRRAIEETTIVTTIVQYTLKQHSLI
jgi:hypothetical protein